MKTVQSLSELGLSDYEARVYLALLKSPDSTGYEASRISGVPRAKVYEVLESLDRKGAILSTNVEGKQLYRSVPASMLISRYRRRTEELLARLEPALTAMENRQAPEALLNVRGQRHVHDLVRQLLGEAQARVLLTGLAADLKALAPEILACSQRGVKVFVLSYGAVVLDGAEVVRHNISGLQYLQTAALGRWLALVTDHRETVMAQLTGNERTSALWTRHPMVVFGIAGWITHDITLFQMESIFSEVKAELPAGVVDRLRLAMEDLQPMWTLDAGELSEEQSPVPEITPQAVQQHLSRLAQDTDLSGRVLFELRGEGGGSWVLELGKAGNNVAAAAGNVPADLRVMMQAADFKAMLNGTLSLSAFVTQGRMQVEGSIHLASVLQGLAVLGE